MMRDELAKKTASAISTAYKNGKVQSDSDLVVILKYSTMTPSQRDRMTGQIEEMKRKRDEANAKIAMLETVALNATENEVEAEPEPEPVHKVKRK